MTSELKMTPLFICWSFAFIEHWHFNEFASQKHKIIDRSKNLNLVFIALAYYW